MSLVHIGANSFSTSSPSVRGSFLCLWHRNGAYLFYVCGITFFLNAFIFFGEMEFSPAIPTTWVVLWLIYYKVFLVAHNFFPTISPNARDCAVCSQHRKAIYLSRCVKLHFFLMLILSSREGNFSLFPRSHQWCLKTNFTIKCVTSSYGIKSCFRNLSHCQGQFSLLIA